MEYIRLFRENTGEGGEAPKLNLSLSELEKLESGDGNTQSPDLNEEIQRAAQQAVAPPVEPAKPVVESTEQAPADGEKLTDKPEDKPAEEQKPAATEEPQENYYDVVDKITGRKYEIEYPESIDPTTPEGTAHRENYIREASFAEYEEFLKEKDPRGYAYLLHRQNKLPDEDFFGDKKGFVLPTVEEMGASADVQTAVYKQDLISMGLDSDTAQTIVEKAVKENKLLERATASHTKIDTAQRTFLASLDNQTREAHTKAVAAVAQVTRSIDNTLGNISLIVPDSEKGAFKQYILDTLQMTDDGKFMIVQELNNDQLKQQIEALFFQYIKGDLNKVVQKKVKTETAHRLSVAASKTQTGTPKDAGVGNTAGKKLTLGDL